MIREYDCCVDDDELYISALTFCLTFTFMRQAGPFFLSLSCATVYILVSCFLTLYYSIFSHFRQSLVFRAPCIFLRCVNDYSHQTRTYEASESYFLWQQVYISPTGLQLRFRFTMATSMTVPFIECPRRHVTYPFLNLLTPTIEYPSFKIDGSFHQMRVHVRHAGLMALSSSLI